MPLQECEVPDILSGYEPTVADLGATTFRPSKYTYSSAQLPDSITLDVNSEFQRHSCFGYLRRNSCLSLG